MANGQSYCSKNKATIIPVNVSILIEFAFLNDAYQIVELSSQNFKRKANSAPLDPFY